MIEQNIGSLLEAHGLKKTAIRVEILGLFKALPYALAAGDIIARMKTLHDRVTIYRALNSFEEHGILHRASEDAKGVKYAMRIDRIPGSTQADGHAHFICDACSNTYCLKGVGVPEIDVSKEYAVRRVDYTLSGICAECDGRR